MQGFFLLLLGLVACASSAANPTAPPPTSAPPAPARIAITFWHSESGALNQTLQGLALDYQRLHPEIEIRIESRGLNLRRDYIDAVRAGGPPDLVLLAENHWIGELAESQLLLDVSPYLLPSDEANLLPAARDGARFKGKTYGLPMTLDVPVLFYNRSNFPGGSPPAATADWLETARAFSVNGQWGLAYHLSWYFTQPYLAAFGGQILDETGAVVLGTTGAPGTEAWLRWLNELAHDDQLLAHDDFRAIERAVLQNNAIMTIDWASNLPNYPAIWGANVGISPLPTLSQTGQDPQPYVRSSVLAINSRSLPAHQTAAFEFMRFLTGSEAQLTLRSMSLPVVRTDLPPADDPFQPAIAEAASRGVAWPTSIQFNKSLDELARMVRNVLKDQPIIEEILKTDNRLRGK